MSRHVVVIGAGLGGLAVAARLATSGHRITVVEQSGRVGGKLGSLRLDSPAGPFTFDTGPSLLTWPEVFTELWDAIDMPDADRPALRRLDPIASYRFADASSNEVFSQPSWRDFENTAQLMWRIGRDHYVQHPLTAGGVLRRLPAIGQLRRLRPLRTLRDLATTQLADERLRLVAQRYATYAGADPARAPAALAMIAGLEAEHGGWYVEGGLFGIADTLHQRLLDLGVEVRLDTEATSIELTGGQVSGIRLASAEEVPADAVVANCDPAVLRQLLARRSHTADPAPASNALARPAPAGAPLAGPALAGFVLLLGLRGSTDGLGHHTVLFPADYRDEFVAAFGSPSRLPHDPTLYISAPSDPLVHPAGHEAWFVLVNVAAHDPAGANGLDWADPARIEAMSRLVLERLAARGLDVRDRLVVRQAFTPADLQRTAAAPAGRIYARAAHGRLGALHPASRTRIRGLFRVGGSAHPGGGLPLVALSARFAAEAIDKS